MQKEGSSSIIESITCTQAGDDGHYMEILQFFNGKALVLDQKAIAMYKNPAAIADPLGNGLIDCADMDNKPWLSLDDAPWVISHRAGFIGLKRDFCLLILPVDVRLYRNKEDALLNKNVVASINL